MDYCEYGEGYFFFASSMSYMFIVLPPGIVMSPGRWPGKHAPSHFASITVFPSYMPIIGGSYFVMLSIR